MTGATDDEATPSLAAALADAGKVSAKSEDSGSKMAETAPSEKDAKTGTSGAADAAGEAPTGGNSSGEGDAAASADAGEDKKPTKTPGGRNKRNNTSRKPKGPKKSNAAKKKQGGVPQYPDYAALLPQTALATTVQAWIDDDMPSFDVGGLVVGSTPATAQLWMKSSGIFAGKPFFDAVFRSVGCQVKWTNLARNEGRMITANGSDKKVLLATVTGPCNQILRGERTALCALSRCSGVATESRAAVDLAKKLGWKGLVAGTRKTTPGFRIVEKYGLLVGGAATHRLDLSQMVMLKDNHVWSAGSIEGAVKLARKAAGFSQKIEVECRNLDEAMEAAGAGADVVMLDNYEPAKLKEDAKAIKDKFPHVIIEASGGITDEAMGDYLSEHVDVVSQGKLTQGYHCLDYSLKIKR